MFVVEQHRSWPDERIVLKVAFISDVGAALYFHPVSDDNPLPDMSQRTDGGALTNGGFGSYQARPPRHGPVAHVEALTGQGWLLQVRHLTLRGRVLASAC